MTLRERLIELASQLPEERLPAALEQMEQLAGVRPGLVEINLRDQPVRPPRLPLRLPFRAPQVVVETETPTAQAAAFTAALMRNARWWRDHYAAVLAAHQCVYGKPFRLPTNGRAHADELDKMTDLIMCHLAALLEPQYRGAYADHPQLKELLAAQA